MELLHTRSDTQQEEHFITWTSVTQDLGDIGVLHESFRRNTDQLFPTGAWILQPRQDRGSLDGDGK